MKSRHDQIEKIIRKENSNICRKSIEKEDQQIKAIAEKLKEFDNLKICHEEDCETLSKLYIASLIDENGEIIQKEVMRF